MKRTGWGHYKLRALSRLLSLKPWMAVGLMECIWHVTAQQAPRGDIGRMPNWAIADAIGWDEDPDKLVEGLVAAGWLDPHPEHRLVIHDWQDHMDETTRKLLHRRKWQVAAGTIPPASADVATCLDMSGQVPPISGSVATCPDISSLPEPEPEPEPEPRPAPEPAHAREPAAAPPPSTFEVGQVEKTPSQTAAFAWYREHVDAQSFLLFGRMMKAAEVNELVDQAALWHENGIRLDENLIKRAVAECLNWCEVNQRKRATIGALITSLSLIVEVDRETQPNSAANGHSPARRVRNQSGQDRQTVPDSQPRDLDPDLSRYVWGNGP